MALQAAGQASAVAGDVQEGAESLASELQRGAQSASSQLQSGLNEAATEAQRAVDNISHGEIPGMRRLLLVAACATVLTEMLGAVIPSKQPGGAASRPLSALASNQSWCPVVHAQPRDCYSLHVAGSPYRRGRSLVSDTAPLTSMSAGGSGEDTVPQLKARLLAHVAGLDRGFAATQRQVQFFVSSQ